MSTRETNIALGLCRGCGGKRDTIRVRCSSCVAHEKKLRDARDRSIQIPVPADVVARFWSRVGPRPEDPRACWDWIDRLDAKGYGQMSVAGQRRRMHRLSYMIAYGAIPEGMGVLHTCDRRCCIRPTHFFLGTNVDNTADMVAKGRHRGPAPEDVQGEKQWQAKLTDTLVIEIRRRIRGGERGVDLARELGVSQATISEAKNGRLWDHITEEPPLQPWRSS